MYTDTVYSFDTIKVRLQTSHPSQFSGPLDCVLKTLKNEGIYGAYKGATPPLVGWMFMDALYARYHHGHTTEVLINLL